MLNLITLVIGNPVFIVLIALILLSIEVLAIKAFQQKDCKRIKTLVDFLRQNREREQIYTQDCEQQMKGLYHYLVRHLDGQQWGEEFQPRKRDHFFLLTDYPAILTKPIPRSPVSFSPPLLTTLGILGTFLGISVGLKTIGIGNMESTQDLLEASTNLLAGMKTAFSTSLAGLGCASVMMIVLAVGSRVRRNIRNSLRKDLGKLAYLESPQAILSRFDSSAMERAGNSIDKVAQSLTNVTDSFTSLQDLSAENIASAIQQAIASDDSMLIRQLKSQTNLLSDLTPQAIASEINSSITPIHQELVHLNQGQSKQESTIQSLLQEFRTQLIEPVTQQLATNAQISNDVANTVKEFKQEIGDMTASMSEAVVTIQEFQQSTLLKLDNFTQTLANTLQQFNQDTKGVLDNVSKEMKLAVAESIQGMGAQREAFEQSSNQASNTFRGIREDLQAVLATQTNQQKEMLAEVKTSTESIFTKANLAFVQQTETIKQVGTEASQLLNQSKENLLATLMNIDDILDQTRITLQEELESFRLEYQSALTLFFDEQNNLLEETLGKQKDGLNIVVQDLQNTFKEEIKTRHQITEEVNHSLVNIQATTKVVSDLVEQTGMNSSQRFEQLKEVAAIGANQAEKVESSYQQMVEKYQDSLELMTNKLEQQITTINDYFETILKQIIEEFNQLSQQTNQQISEYLSNANDSYNESFKRADSSMADICRQLNNTSNGLMNVAEYLVASANDLKFNQ